jgi:hypothetical protein
MSTRLVSSGGLDPGDQQIFLIYNPYVEARGTEGMKEVVPCLGHLKERIPEDVGRHFKHNVGCVRCMDCLPANFAVNLCEDRSHSSHTLFLPRFLLVPYFTRFQHAYIHQTEMFTSLALGGGGVRGVIHVGGLAALEATRGNLTFPDGVYGCSIGAIVATAVAFGLTSAQIKEMMIQHFDVSRFLPTVRMSSFRDVVVSKGAFDMELFDIGLLAAFQSQGLDLRDKLIRDASQPLFIAASNITTRRPVFFTGRIPLLEALRCSCCLPLVYTPQVLRGNVYLDGGLYMNSLDEFVPPGTLVFHISYSPRPVTPANLSDLSVVEFLKHLYVGRVRIGEHANRLWFQEDEIHILEELTPEKKERMYQIGYSQALQFLSKRAAEKLE